MANGLLSMASTGGHTSSPNSVDSLTHRRKDRRSAAALVAILPHPGIRFGRKYVCSLPEVLFRRIWIRF